MVEEEITISDLIKKFNLNLKLPERLLLYELSSDFLKAKLEKNKGSYIFSVDSVKLIINPKDKNETIKKLVIDDEGNVLGGVILNNEDIQYLN